MAIIRDIRNQTPRSNSTRKLSAIKYIVRHHSASEDGDFFSFWRYWNGTKGWGTGGYHEIILRDGSVQLCYDPNEITNGVAGHNTACYHICVVGNGSFTKAQEVTFKERCQYNMKRLGVGVNNVKGHREMRGASTSCPGIDMNVVREALKHGGLPGGTENVDPWDKGYLINKDRGNSVKTVQVQLNKFPFVSPKLTEDGMYGPGTKKGVEQFQRHFKLSVDGVYGPASEAMMKKQLKLMEVAMLADRLFKDLDPNTEVGRNAEKLHKAGILNGFPDGTAGATKNITRGQVINMIARLLDKIEE